MIHTKKGRLAAALASLLAILAVNLDSVSPNPSLPRKFATGGMSAALLAALSQPGLIQL